MLNRINSPAVLLPTAGLVGIAAFCAFFPGSEGNSPASGQLVAAKGTSPKKTGNSEIDGRLQFTRAGKLLRPTGYRKWIYVGTPLTPNDMNAGTAAFPEFHAVYINPEAYVRYEKTGRFPDGTIVVKELISVGSKKAASGRGYFMGDFTGLEVAIKDKSRFKKEPGNWAYFSFGHKYPLAKSAVVQQTANCNTCHSTADDDFVFTQYYPVLRAAKRRAATDE